MASAQTLHMPGHTTQNPGGSGFFVRLMASGGAFAVTGVEHLDTNPAFMYRGIYFTMNGPTSNFFVRASYSNHGVNTNGVFLTVGNGITQQGNSFLIDTHTIPAGSRITLLEFQLDQGCDSSAPVMTDDVSNVFIDKFFVNYELDPATHDIENESSFCTGVVPR